MKLSLTSLACAAALSATMVGGASAQQTSVRVPSQIYTQEDHLTYQRQLDVLAKRTCQKAVTGTVLAFETYLSCLKDIRMDLSRQDYSRLYRSQYIERREYVRPLGRY